MDLVRTGAHGDRMTTPLHPSPGPVVDGSTPARTSAQRLRNTLRVNGSVSALCGIAAAAFAPWVDDVLGTGHPGWVRAVGLGLVVFGAAVVFLAGRRASALRRWATIVVAADAAWLAATALAIALGWFSGPGIAVMAAVGVFVGACAVRQWAGIRRLRRIDLAPVDESPPVEVVHVQAQVKASPAAVWPVLIDHELYGRLAPNLGAVRPTSTNGPELTRVCSTRGGTQWSESCTLWEDGRRFEIAVDTSVYPYPLEEMRGSWWLEPHGDGSLVGMDFRFRPAPGIRGAVFVVLMQLAFPVVLRRIIRGWRRAATQDDSTAPRG